VTIGIYYTIVFVRIVVIIVVPRVVCNTTWITSTRAHTTSRIEQYIPSSICTHACFSLTRHGLYSHYKYDCVYMILLNAERDATHAMTETTNAAEGEPMTMDCNRKQSNYMLPKQFCIATEVPLVLLVVCVSFVLKLILTND